MEPVIQWLTMNWHVLIPDPWTHIAITAGALICGGIIGGEREKRDKPAGLRTLVLVCLGSAIFTMVSFAFGTTTGDTGRVAAQIVSGIGFLGAGVILHGRTSVSGITTAATIWTTAAIGIVAGVGYLGGALGLSLVVRCVLSGIFTWEQQFLGDPRSMTIQMKVKLSGGKARFRLERIMDDYNIQTPLEVQAAAPEALSHVRLSFKLPRRQCVELMDELAHLPYVQEIREVTAMDPSQLRQPG